MNTRSTIGPVVVDRLWIVTDGEWDLGFAPDREQADRIAQRLADKENRTDVYYYSTSSPSRAQIDMARNVGISMRGK